MEQTQNHLQFVLLLQFLICKIKLQQSRFMTIAGIPADLNLTRYFKSTFPKLFGRFLVKIMLEIELNCQNDGLVVQRVIV